MKPTDRAVSFANRGVANFSRSLRSRSVAFWFRFRFPERKSAERATADENVTFKDRKKSGEPRNSRDHNPLVNNMDPLAG